VSNRLSFQRERAIAKENSTRPRWANSGVVIGSVKAMLELYKDLVEIFRDPDAQHSGDQGNRFSPVYFYLSRSLESVCVLNLVCRKFV
jgi:hypothetical protein